MRKTNLIIASFIAMVGIIIYFVSIPTTNNENLADLTVKAGNEELLDDVYFNGYILGDNTHINFHLNEEQGVQTNEDLSYFEKLDAPAGHSLKMLQEKHPEFVDDFIYDNGINLYYILNSENGLVSGHFENNETNYAIDTSTVYLNALNKETNEMVEDEVNRQDHPDGDYINIIGMYEEYPTVKIIYDISTWHSNNTGEKSHLTVGEYNFETKNYSETALLNEEGNFSGFGSDRDNAKNNDLQLIQFHETEIYDEMNPPSQPSTYLYDFVEDKLSPLENSTANYFIGNENQLFALENEGEEVFLREYSQTGEEVINEVALDLETPLNLNAGYPSLLTEVSDNQLVIVQSAVAEMPNQEVQPTDVQVFDIRTGESLLTGTIDFDPESEVNPTEAVINAIGQMSDY